MNLFYLIISMIGTLIIINVAIILYKTITKVEDSVSVFKTEKETLLIELNKEFNNLICQSFDESPKTSYNHEPNANNERLHFKNFMRDAVNLINKHKLTIKKRIEYEKLIKNTRSKNKTIANTFLLVIPNCNYNNQSVKSFKKVTYNYEEEKNCSVSSIITKTSVYANYEFNFKIKSIENHTFIFVNSFIPTLVHYLEEFINIFRLTNFFKMLIEESITVLERQRIETEYILINTSFIDIYSFAGDLSRFRTLDFRNAYKLGLILAVLNYKGNYKFVFLK